MFAKIKRKFAEIRKDNQLFNKCFLRRGITSGSENERFPIHIAFSFMFSVASAIGLHVISRDNHGKYNKSRLKLLPAYLQILHISTALGIVFYLNFFTEMSYNQHVLLLPIFFGCWFCLYVFLYWIRRSEQLIRYLMEIESISIEIKKPTKIPVIIMGISSYSLVYVICLLALAEYSTYAKLGLVGPVMVISFVPSFLDMYMFSFVYVISEAIQKLREKYASHSWTAKEVDGAANSWLAVRKVLNAHNEVFSYMLKIRLDLFLGQAMSFFFYLSSVDIFCPELLLATVIPLGELTVRLYCICFAGDHVIARYNELVDGLKENLCASKSKTLRERAECPLDYTGLHNLLSRMEATPMDVQVWGKDRLCASTFIRQLGLVMTYLLVLIQLGP